MKKKMIMTLLSVVMLSSLLEGCGDKPDDTIGGEISDSTIGVEISSEESDSTIDTEVLSEEPEKKQDANKVAVVNLSEQNHTEICIDYSIKNYQPVQDFGFALFKENRYETNPVLSPVSAYIALTMVGNGAGGDTRLQFLDVLGKNGDMTVMSDSMMNMLPQKTDRLEIALANSAWIDNEFTVKEEWIGEVTSLYDAEVFKVDIASDEAMNAMNEWVNEETQGLIEKMIEEPLDAVTRLVLFNTLYFDADWQKPFMKESTYEEEFHISDTETVYVPMMHQYDESYEFFENDYLKGVVLPYADSNYAFVGILPQGNADIRSNLSAQGLSDLLAGRQSHVIHLKLPKFEVSFDKILNESLQNMGLVDAFEGQKADFSNLGITDNGNPLYIGFVRQKAVVKVDEERTEAAAATEVAMMECSMELVEEPIQMHFDQPFLYFIMDMETELPLFMGIMDNPAAE